jgi:hypothetical protein
MVPIIVGWPTQGKVIKNNRFVLTRLEIVLKILVHSPQIDHGGDTSGWRYGEIDVNKDEGRKCCTFNFCGKTLIIRPILLVSRQIVTIGNGFVCIRAACGRNRAA